jgi:Tol biopolymer transport system component
MRVRRWLGAVCAAAAVASGCDTNPAGSKPGEPGIRFVAGHTGTDSVDAVLAQTLVVEVRDGEGRLAAGITVAFDGTPNAAVAGPGQGWQYRTNMLTDGQGRAFTRVRLGTAVGEAAVAVIVGGLPFTDTARYTVTAGQPAKVAAAPRDSAVWVARAYTLRAAVTDRHGNPRPEAPTYTAGTANVSVSGGAVRGEAVGRGYVLARYGTFTDTAWVSVVPPGLLAAYGGGRIVALNTDGSEYRVLLEQLPPVGGAGYGEGMHPSWAPQGGDLAYLDGSRLMLRKASGETRVVVSGGEPVHVGFTPQWSPDGAWIYFSRGWQGNQLTSWRVRPDGTGLQQVSPLEDWGMETMPSPDPTGDRVAYQTNRVTNSPIEFTLRTRRLSTGAVSAIDVPGQFPHWSPTGEWIAYILNDPYNPLLRLVRPDGSGGHLIGGGSGIGAHPAFSWSADGQWLVISGNLPRPGDPFAVGLSLVNVATGEVLPLRFGPSVVQPSWHR